MLRGKANSSWIHTENISPIMEKILQNGSGAVGLNLYR